MIGYLIREHGFVVSSSLDWTLSQSTFPLSLIFFFPGVASALAGNWQMKVGLRAAMATGALLFGGGMLIGSYGVYTHNLWLLYFGYGFLSGLGVGIAYTPPLQALIEWFPDRKGLAGGLTVGGFGSGAMIFTFLFSSLANKFQKLPEFAGSVETLKTVTKNGKLFSEDGKEVVLANAFDLAKFKNDLSEGFYYVGTGDTGTVGALVTSGIIYMSIMLASAFYIKKPAASYSVANTGLNPSLNKAHLITENVHVNTVMKTPQYWFLAGTFYCLATGGMGVFSVAKPMILEIFGQNLPNIVTAGFASAFVIILSAGNLVGRIAWSMLSDKIGRRKTFFIFTLGSIPLYFSLPFLVNAVAIQSSVASLYAFVGCSVLAISMMGGCYSILPAYEADLFGTKYVGAIHGRILLASSAAAVSGPYFYLTLRNKAELKAIHDLLKQVDETQFKNMFGADLSHSNELIQAKTLTINKLMSIMPEGVVNPSPFIYDSSMYLMTGLMILAACFNYKIMKVDPKFYEKNKNN